MSHGKIKYCGSPEFFAKKFDHTLDFTFTTFKSSENKLQRQNKYKDLKSVVYSAVLPKYKEKVSIEWNSLNQLVLKFPVGLTKFDVNKVIDMDIINAE